MVGEQQEGLVSSREKRIEERIMNERGRREGREESGREW